MASKQALIGQNDPTADTHPYNTHNFLIRQLMAGMATATLVKVVKCSNNGEVKPPGTVDVKPLVKLIDGAGQTFKRGTIYGLPYFRAHAKKQAVILDPKKDDIGIMVFADRDISVVKKNKDEAQPGSYRRFNPSDGLYVGLCMGKDDDFTPEDYVRFHDQGIDVVTKTNPVTVKCGSNSIFEVKNDFVRGKYDDARFVASAIVAKIRKGGSWVVVDGSDVIVSKPPIVGPDPDPN